MSQPPPMNEYQLKVLIKRFFMHKDKNVRQTDNLRNVATRAYAIGYEKALQDLRKQDENQNLQAKTTSTGLDCS